MKHWIQTFTGKQFSPLDPKIENLDIVDVAHALAFQCRFAGHVSRFYSVAEHSVRVSRRVEAVVEALKWGSDDRVVATKWGLVHDAAEAYMGDMVRPLKTEPSMAPFRVAEAHLMRYIAAWLDLPPDEPDVVRAVDHSILGTEVRQLKAPVHPGWDALPDDDLPHAILGWAPEVAKRNFLTRFRRLWGYVEDYTDTNGRAR